MELNACSNSNTNGIMLLVQARFVESYNFAVPANKSFQRNNSNPCNEPSFNLNREFIYLLTDSYVSTKKRGHIDIKLI